MSWYKSSRSRAKRKMWWGIVLAALGVGALLLVSQAIQNTTEMRSQAAAENELTFRQWEFNGTDAEGWKGKNLSPFNVQNGLLQAVVAKPDRATNLGHSSVGAELPFGIKRLRMRLAVTADSGGMATIPEAKPGEKTSPGGGAQPSRPQAVEVKYMLKGKKSWETPLKLEVTVDGTMQEYEVAFPETGSQLSLARLQIEFPQIVSLTPVSFDWIRLTGVVEGGGGSTKPSAEGQTVTKEGVVQQERIGGVTTSRYNLVVSAEETYRLNFASMGRSQSGTRQMTRFGRSRGGGSEPSVSGVNPETYMDKRVRVSGILMQQSGLVGVVLPPTIVVQSISLL